ncbi:MAG TPA: hypothetical protein VNW97_14085 [Candidatus Saccharimonadales bacterium]|nr:hypothetical protein [Candidatus Saccharimonadales bacterium]
MKEAFAFKRETQIFSMDWGVKPWLKPHVSVPFRAASAARFDSCANIFPQPVGPISLTVARHLSTTSSANRKVHDYQGGQS